MTNEIELEPPASCAGKKSWHKPVVTALDFDRTAAAALGGPGDAGCCCCGYTPS